MKIQRTNTILYCQRWNETVSFYNEIFAFPISHQTDWFIEFQITDDSYLSIADERRATIKSVNGEGITLSWQVLDVHETHNSLSKLGLEVTEITKRWGAWSFYCHDPEGHRIEIWQSLSK